MRSSSRHPCLGVGGLSRASPSLSLGRTT